MKKVVIIGVVIIFFVLIALALSSVFKSGDETVNVPEPNFPVVTEPAGATDQEPARFVKAFYEWYLLNLTQNELFPNMVGRDEILSPWLTKEFIATWDERFSYGDANPVLLAEEDPLTWGNQVSARVTAASAQRATVYATIGSGATLHAYTVELIKDQQGSWKIAEVSIPI